MTTLAPPATGRVIAVASPAADWSAQSTAGWNEFRIRRALFLASLTLQAALVPSERLGGDPSLVEGHSTE